MTFRHAETIAFTEQDTWGNEGALGWNHGMRWGTALMFLDFAAVIAQTMSKVAYPFLILHDPADKVCNIAGSRRLVAESCTPAEQKQLTEVMTIPSTDMQVEHRRNYTEKMLSSLSSIINLPFLYITFTLIAVTWLSARSDGQRACQRMRARACLDG